MIVNVMAVVRIRLTNRGSFYFKNICEESQTTDCKNNNQLVRDLFNQPEIGRRLNRMWPEDLIR
jgi:hypothetical protein